MIAQPDSQPPLLLHLRRAAATCIALMLAGLFHLNTHPAVFQLGLAGFALAGGVGNAFGKPVNRQMTPVAVAFGALFLLHLVAGIGV